MSSTATLAVVAPGALATIQDLGRPGWRHLGVPRAGALDPGLLRIANVLAGNPQGAPVIEFFVSGPTLKAIDAPLTLGLAGDFAATLQRADGQRLQLSPWRSVTLQPGDTLQAGATRATRVGCIAVAGLAVPLVLGSAATYTRAGLGGHQGRALATGDVLTAAAQPLHSGTALAQRVLRWPPAAPHAAPHAASLAASSAAFSAAATAASQATSTVPIRVVPGPQADHFDAAVLDGFFAAAYAVSADADRMGVRLLGPALAHRADKGSEIVSDATVPGSIQVPGNGQPIVLLADGQTAGGYPKIGTVISADLPRLATAAVGASIRFQAVSVAQAEAIARAHEASLQQLLATVQALVLDGDIDLNAIYDSNLVSGMIDALDRP